MNQEITMRNTFFLIGIAFIFSFTMRLIWVYQFSGYEPFIFNGEFIIGTNDGYYYAKGAQDILAGAYQVNGLSPVGSALSKITAFFATILPFSFETILFYMPAFLSSLIVIPLVLIGKNLGEIEGGFIGALVASIAMSYYNRTMVGYYDTDMLNIVFPTFLLWSLILALRTKELKYILFTALEIIAYRWWYPQSYSLEFAFFGLIALFVLYLFVKKEDVKYELFLLSFMLFAMMGLSDLVRLVIVITLFITLQRGWLEKYVIWLLVVAVGVFFATGGFDPIWLQLKGYVFRDTLIVTGEELKLYFYAVNQTIREAGKIPFELFASRISGHQITFILAFGGYLWLAYRYKAMLLALPLVGLGFLAYVGGLRFTIYAVPPMALGAGYLIYRVSNLSAKPKNYIFMGLLTSLALAPNIIHIIDYKVPTVFSKDEVEVLDKMRTIASRDDYIVSWWDYGYPIRYYSDVKTLIDGGKHDGDVNFATSFALSHSQDAAVKLLRFDVEYTEKHFLLDVNDSDRNRTNIANIILDYDFTDANDFLAYIESGSPIKMPSKSRDIYLFLPNDMLSIFPTISKFSEIDLMSGKMGEEPFFFMTRFMQDRGDYIDLSRGIAFDKSGKYVLMNDTKIPLKRFITTKYDKDMQLQINSDAISADGELYGIFMSDYRQLLLLDEQMFNSTFIQLFVLQNYDEQYFKPVILTPFAKVYKLMK